MNSMASFINEAPLLAVSLSGERTGSGAVCCMSVITTGEQVSEERFVPANCRQVRWGQDENHASVFFFCKIEIKGKVFVQVLFYKVCWFYRWVLCLFLLSVWVFGFEWWRLQQLIFLMYKNKWNKCISFLFLCRKASFTGNLLSLFFFKNKNLQSSASLIQNVLFVPGPAPLLFFSQKSDVLDF